MNQSTLHISVIIPTRNRADSLRITLECLASADREGVQAEIIVVDNGSNDDTKEVVAEFGGRIPLRYLFEPAQGVYGKSHSLNTALDSGGLGDIIAVLDDDMSPHSNWFHGVAASRERWPDKDLFGGDIYTVWPCEDVPAWARTQRSQILILSSGALGDSETPLPDGWWFGGNHFWFTSRAIEGNRRFQDIWLTEPAFQLDLVDCGFAGMWWPQAKAGHRVQSVLLQKSVALDRAGKLGVAQARLRLQPYRESSKQARFLRSHPWTSRVFYFVRLVGWHGEGILSHLFPADGGGFDRKCAAVYRIAYYRELLRAATLQDDYSLWPAKRKREGEESLARMASGAKRP